MAPDSAFAALAAAAQGEGERACERTPLEEECDAVDIGLRQKPSMIDRRHFTFALAGAAFAGLSACARNPGLSRVGSSSGLGSLRPDPQGLLDLPDGFSYRVISEAGALMSDGLRVPDRFDGMGSFAAPDGRVILVRNHELGPKHFADGPAGAGGRIAKAFDRNEQGALPGGTTTLVWNPRTGRVDAEYLSLAGTIRNCAGGVTPWGSWLSCEEDVSRAGKGLRQDHGWVFEVPATARGLFDPVPLKALGRFNHEAASVDPRTGIVCLTEDRDDGLFYRFLPAARGALARRCSSTSSAPAGRLPSAAPGGSFQMARADARSFQGVPTCTFFSRLYRSWPPYWPRQRLPMPAHAPSMKG
jgi:secreted PhoX family phosphatase